MNKNKVTRFLALLLGTTMAISVVGCGNQGNENKKSESSKKESVKEDASKEDSSDASVAGEIPVDYFKGTTLEIAVAKQINDLSEDFNEKPIIKRATEQTGINIKWTLVDDAAVGERTAAMLASGELPDAMLGMIGTGDLVKNAEMFYDLSQDGLLETYCPDVLEHYEKAGQEVMSMLTMKDGSIRSLVTGSGASYGTAPFAAWWINKAWLDQLGLEVPKTGDDLYDVLCAFRDNDMNGNGKEDEIPLAFCNQDYTAIFMNFADMFGIAGANDDPTTYYYKIRDGKVSPTLNTDEFKAFLEYCNKLVSEGLMDAEGFSQTWDQYTAKQAEGRIGMFMMWDASYTPNQDDYILMTPPQALEGVEPIKTGIDGYFFGNLSGFVASAETENIEALLHWWNFIGGSIENIVISRGGEEGTAWYKDENGEYVSGLKPGVTVENYAEVAATAQFPNSSCPYTPLYVFKIAKGTTRLQGLDMYYDMMLSADAYLAPRLIDAKSAEDGSFLRTDLMPMISNFIGTSVVDGITDDSWENFLADLDSYGYQEWLDWVQAYYNGEL